MGTENLLHRVSPIKLTQVGRVERGYVKNHSAVGIGEVTWKDGTEMANQKPRSARTYRACAMYQMEKNIAEKLVVTREAKT